jgi:hypothetical protein
MENPLFSMPYCFGESGLCPKIFVRKMFCYFQESEGLIQICPLAGHHPRHAPLHEIHHMLPITTKGNTKQGWEKLVKDLVTNVGMEN